MSTDAPAAMDTIVLPLLENISLSFPSDQEMHYYPCFLSILDFPNVINIDVKFTAKNTGCAIRHTPGNVRALLRPQTGSNS